MSYASRQIGIHSSAPIFVIVYIKKAIELDQVLRILLLELEKACGAFNLF